MQSDECRVQSEPQSTQAPHASLIPPVFILHSALITLHSSIMSYAQPTDVEAVFGPQAVAAWSLFADPGSGGGGGGPAADPFRVAAALAYADAEVDAFFSAGPYAVPLAASPSAAPVVTYWAAVIAGCWLYGSRAGVSYVDYAGTRFLALKAAVYADMQLYKAGVKRLDATAAGRRPTAPTAV